MSSSHAGPSACRPATPPGCTTTHDHQRQDAQRRWEPGQEEEGREHGRIARGGEYRHPIAPIVWLTGAVSLADHLAGVIQPTRAAAGHQTKSSFARSWLHSSSEVHTSLLAPSLTHNVTNNNPAGVRGAYRVFVAVVAVHGRVVGVHRPWSAVVGHLRPQRGDPQKIPPATPLAVRGSKTF